MPTKRLWIELTLPVVALMVLASLAGLFVESVYAKENVSWAAQGMGQDVVNLAVVVPALLIGAHYMRRGSTRALLVWMGGLLYTLYSYVLYAFFIHFGPWFLVYVAVLGLSFYTLLGAAASVSLETFMRQAARTRTAPASAFLALVGILFSLLWLSDIVGALEAGGVPQGVAELGFAVNPVHVLDLAFLCPGMIITAVLLRRRRPLGLLFAVPLLVFAALMGTAILAMMGAMRLRGLPAEAGPAILISAIVVSSTWLAIRFAGDLDPSGAASS